MYQKWPGLFFIFYFFFILLVFYFDLVIPSLGMVHISLAQVWRLLGYY